MAKEITLVFEWDGKTVHKETSGFSGKSCTEETKFIEEELSGGKVKNLRLKAAYNKRTIREENNTGNQLRARN